MPTWSKGILNDLVYRGKGETPKNMPTTPGAGQITNLNIPGQDQQADQRKAFFMAKLGNIGGYSPGISMGDSDYLAKAEEMMFRANQLNQKAALVRASRPVEFTGRPADVNVGNLIGGGGKAAPVAKGNLGKFIQAIAGKESGGNYSAVNKDSGAMGKYQIMPANIAGPGGWDKEALGRDISPQEFLNNPQIQEKIAQHKLRQYYSKYGPKGAASAWYSGDPNKWKNTSPQGGYPSINAYVMSILKAMGI